MLADTAPPQRVLVVDDEPDITGLVSYHLAKAGYRVMTVADGREALQLAREQRPDLVVLDLMLPVVSGYDVVAEPASGRRACPARQSAAHGRPARAAPAVQTRRGRGVDRDGARGRLSLPLG